MRVSGLLALLLFLDIFFRRVRLLCPLFKFFENFRGNSDLESPEAMNYRHFLKSSEIFITVKHQFSKHQFQNINFQYQNIQIIS